jgi:hypothetical protein
LATGVFRRNHVGGCVVADVKRVFDDLERVFGHIDRAAGFMARLDALGNNERLYAAMLQRRLRRLIRDLVNEAIKLLDEFNTINDN